MNKLAVVVGALALGITASAQACDYKNETPVKMLSAGFPAWKAVTAQMSKCGNFQAELDQEFRKKQPAAFKANPSLYHLGGVAGSTILPLLNEGTIRPLDDLVAKYGKNLKPNQLIKIDGKTSRAVILPYFRARRIRRLDALIVSHPDLDHAAGVADILQALPVERRYYGGSAASVPEISSPCTAYASQVTAGRSSSRRLACASSIVRGSARDCIPERISSSRPRCFSAPMIR